jgi:chemotaxis response regulator CheB
VLALRKRELVAERRARPAPAAHTAAGDDEGPPFDVDDSLPPPAPMNSREAIAKAARLSSSQVVMIEKIQKQAAPELVAAVKSGTISLNAAAAVASLPVEEQTAAVNGGKDELKQAAKRVRDAKRKPRETSADDEAPADTGESID